MRPQSEKSEGIFWVSRKLVWVSRKTSLASIFGRFDPLRLRIQITSSAVCLWCILPLNKICRFRTWWKKSRQQFWSYSSSNIVNNQHCLRFWKIRSISVLTPGINLRMVLQYPSKVEKTSIKFGRKSTECFKKVCFFFTMFNLFFFRYPSLDFFHQGVSW